MNKRRKYNYTDSQLITAIRNSGSIKETITKLGIVISTNTYRSINLEISRLGLDTSHFIGKVHNRGKRDNSIEYYLVKKEKRLINSHSLKIRLIECGLKKHICEICNNSEWLGNKIPLELHRIDGDKNNNLLGNIQLLCPNCHAFTDTYRAKNRRLLREKKKLG